MLAASGLVVSTIDVVRNADLRTGDSTQGIVREVAFGRPEITIARSRIAGGVASAWHHHGERDLYGFLVHGHLRLEYGSRGSLAVEFDPGDFFHIPPRLVHRDVNSMRDREALVVNVLAGKGAAVINVDGPDD